jgi:hypothetical protein
MTSRRISKTSPSQRRAQQRQLTRELTAIVSREFRNMSAQWQAAMFLHTYLLTGKRIGPLQGWPVSPDLGLLLVNLVADESYQAIVEFGSGTSTMLMATANLNLSRSGDALIPQLAFEHLEDFHRNTRQLLHTNRLEVLVTLVKAPLVPVELEGKTYGYYSCDEELAKLAADLGDRRPGRPILVLVAGPPGATNPQARYPALHFMLKHFPRVGLHLLMDEMVRDDERQIVERWCRELTVIGRKYTKESFAFEKGATLLRVSPKS